MDRDSKPGGSHLALPKNILHSQLSVCAAKLGKSQCFCDTASFQAPHTFRQTLIESTVLYFVTAMLTTWSDSGLCWVLWKHLQ